MVAMEQHNKLRILLVEDLPSDAELAERELKRQGIHYTLKITDNKEDFLRELEDFQPDLVISDYLLPQFDGMEVIKLTAGYDESVPVLVLTGSMNEETAVECMKAGAWDYVIKEHIKRLGPAVTQVVEKKKLLIQHNRMFEELERSERLLKESQAISKAGGWEYDVDKKRITWTDEVYRIYGVDKNYDPNDIEKAIGFYSEEDQKIVETAFKEAVNNRKEYDLELKFNSADGKRKWVRTAGKPVVKDGKVVKVVGNIMDITDRKRTEEDLRESFRLSDSLLQTLPFGFDLVDEEGNILFMNDRFEKVFGRDAIGKKCWEVYRDDKTQCEDCPLISGIELGEVGVVESHGVMNGRIYHISHSGMMLRGKKVMLEIFQDITDQKQVEKALAQSEREYRELVENAVVGVFKTNIEGRILYVNKALAGIFEFDSLDEMLSEEVLMRYKNSTHRSRLIGELKQYGYVENFETEMITKTGKTKNIVLSASLDGDIISGMMRDVTGYHVLQQQLIQSQKLESIGTLAGGIAHDFNNILGIIMGHGHLLEQVRNDDEKFSKSHQAILDATERGTSLVQKLMIFARQDESSYEAKQINDLIRDTKAIIRDTLPRYITIETELDEKIPVIAIDPTQFNQVLLNLCVNARDAMPHGGTLTIKTKLVDVENIRTKYPDAESSKYTCVEVSDTGVGIDEDTRQRLFEPFFTTKEKGKGTGLGLPVVYGVVKNHRGFIDIESEKGKGTTFYVYFPLNLLAKEIADGISPADEMVTGGTETILLVEDEYLLREMVREFLSGKGYTIIEAADADEAIEVYQREKAAISMALLDVGLPKMSGLDVVKKLREMGGDIKYILASGYLDPSQRSEMIELQVGDFIQKPYDPGLLLKTVRSVLDDKK